MTANQLRQPPESVISSLARTGLAVGQWIGDNLYAVVEDARSLGRPPKPGTDDASIGRRVEAEILRGCHALKGSIAVTVVNGVVWLRGEVTDPRHLRDIEARARAVPDVNRVENHIWLDGTPVAR